MSALFNPAALAKSRALLAVRRFSTAPRLAAPRSLAVPLSPAHPIASTSTGPATTPTREEMERHYAKYLDVEVEDTPIPAQVDTSSTGPATSPTNHYVAKEPYFVDGGEGRISLA